MYNTTINNFNKYHLEGMSDNDLVEYAKLLIKDASNKEDAMNQNGTYNNSYEFASSATKVSHIMNYINRRNLIDSDFKFGYVDGEMYGSKNIIYLLDLF